MAGATGNVYYGLHEFDEMMFLLNAIERHVFGRGRQCGRLHRLGCQGIGACSEF